MVTQPSQTHLLIIEDDKGRKEFLLKDDVYFVGKSPDCHLQLLSPFVSRRHATLERRQHSDGTYYYQISDGYPNGKPSANGILINGRRVTTHILQDPDEIVLERRQHSDGTYYYQISDGYPDGKPSANGILINGRRVTTHILQDQDEIVF